MQNSFDNKLKGMLLFGIKKKYEMDYKMSKNLMYLINLWYYKFCFYY